MKRSINLQGHIFSIHTELPVSHCLIGRRHYDWESPSEEVLRRAQFPAGQPLTPEEAIAVARYKRSMAVEGKYSVHALAWTEGGEEAERLKARFSEPEWDQATLKIIPVE